MGEIKNKIKDAGLVTLDITELYIKGVRKEIDLSIFLNEDLIVIESLFKEKLNSFNWLTYKNCFVALNCSKDVIIPPWAYLLIQVKLLNIAKQVFFCDLNSMEMLLFERSLRGLNKKDFKNKKVFLKVCAGKDFPLGALSLCVSFLSPCVKSLFYGEPCSSVPLIKN